MSMWHGNEPGPQLNRRDRSRQKTAHISPCKWCFHATFIEIEALSHKITPSRLFSWAGTNLLCLHSSLLLNSCTARTGPVTPLTWGQTGINDERVYSQYGYMRDVVMMRDMRRDAWVLLVCFDRLSFQRLPLFPWWSVLIKQNLDKDICLSAYFILF